MGIQVRVPAEVLSLPPPPLVNKGSAWMGFVGWLAALADNLVQRRPVLGAGVHRQLLWATVGFYIGYQMNKRAIYNFAARDRDISEYIRHHPEDFKPKEKKTMAEVLENFHPIR
ncbi:NADH dehydrogenase [ubiquinone] 1 subunit C2 [Tiliqua scincoides]|uniref:NADH dehydrogenase [ubiquinone] 1 subunit C2 n=1 Tax=Tiliqua scincoides TaxID=71010 RepID=UPI003462D5ED